MGLITQSELLSYLKSNAAPGSTLYSQYAILRRSVEQAVKAYCKWPLECNNGQGQGNFIEFYDGQGYPDIILRKPWVANCSAVYLSSFGNYGGGTNAFAPASLLTQGTMYMLVLEQPSRCQSGLLRMLSNNFYGWFPSDYMWGQGSAPLSYSTQPRWPRGTGNVKVVYDWGFQPSTAISSISWSGGIATMVFANAIVARPGDWFQITNEATPLWAGDYQVNTIDATFKNVTFSIASNPGSFVAGNADFIPLDIKDAVAQAVKIQSLMMLRGGRVQGESLGDYQYSLHFRDKEFLDVKSLLAPYRDWSVGIGL